MANKEKIDVSGYLKYLNRRVNEYNLYHEKVEVDLLDCKKLAERIGVTAATITNLNTDSKFSLVSDITEEICYAYSDFFRKYDAEQNKDLEEENGEYPFFHDFKYIMWELMTTYK